MTVPVGSNAVARETLTDHLVQTVAHGLQLGWEPALTRQNTRVKSREEWIEQVRDATAGLRLRGRPWGQMLRQRPGGDLEDRDWGGGGYRQRPGGDLETETGGGGRDRDQVEI